jgi:hypothetical protein
MAGENFEPKPEESSESLVSPEDSPSFSDYDLLVLDMTSGWQRFLELSVERVMELEQEDRIS